MEKISKIENKTCLPNFAQFRIRRQKFVWVPALLSLLFWLYHTFSLLQPLQFIIRKKYFIRFKDCHISIPIIGTTNCFNQKRVIFYFFLPHLVLNYIIEGKQILIQAKLRATEIKQSLIEPYLVKLGGVKYNVQIGEVRGMKFL